MLVTKNGKDHFLNSKLFFLFGNPNCLFWNYDLSVYMYIFFLLNFSRNIYTKISGIINDKTGPSYRINDFKSKNKGIGDHTLVCM